MNPPPIEYLSRATFQDGIFTRAMELGCCPVLASAQHGRNVWLCGCLDNDHGARGTRLITAASIAIAARGKQ